ncbi:uncharacterized protein EDB93DRAFT_1278990 [Suillus bovinus]|uniref:uncharacterized protein n=1 Tax=Suillus bovinus TaxID=48563 RepID=UPI001B85C441|nr:uncharacterized protein EDB93DRAFT_1278990 [Suillus bovinus]KAG2149029.1 hypothetical protein EDB93DRAFT_1278990 [Suillus bovinus]
MDAQQSKTAGSTHHLYNGRRASLPLNIIAIGCDLGGLAAAYCLTQAGHNITILGAALAVNEVGAGVQANPNDSRLEKLGVKIQDLNFQRWNKDEVAGWTPFGDVVDRKYDSPFYLLHRADFHPMLYEATDSYCNIHVNSRDVSMDPSKFSVTLASGEVVSDDLIIGNDGLKSVTRKWNRIWMGLGGHIVGHAIRANAKAAQRAKKEFNLVKMHPDETEGGIESWTAEGNVNKMKKTYKGWRTTVQKLMALVPSTRQRSIGKLMDRDPGKPLTDLAYQSLRHDRATTIQKSSRLNHHHQPDGPEQEELDHDMRVLTSNADQWADKTKCDIQFGYDADEAEMWWLANRNKLVTLVPSTELKLRVVHSENRDH